jgi:hypothetical protein
MLDSPLESAAWAVGEVNERFRSIREVAFPRLADRSLSSTLAFCWIPTERASHPAIAGRVGDCGVFTLRGDAYAAPFGRDDGALNVVAGSLPSERPLECLELIELDLSDRELLVLATDGMAEDIFGSPTVRSWLASRWSGPCGVYRMLEALRYRRRGSHDDRTALAVWLEPVGVPSEASTPEPPQDPWGAPEGNDTPCE